MKVKLLLVLLVSIVAYWLQGYMRPDVAYYWARLSNFYWEHYGLLTWVVIFTPGIIIALKISTMIDKLLSKKPTVPLDIKKPTVQVEVMPAEVVYTPTVRKVYLGNGEA